MQTWAILGLLTGKQSFFLDKMSQMVIRESSNLDETSSDDELRHIERDSVGYAKSMAHSTD